MAYIPTTDGDLDTTMEVSPDMNYSMLSEPDAVLAWFRDPCFDLCELGATDKERLYLQSIDDVARRTGSPNFWLADYILNLEKRISRIESALNA